MNCSLEGELNRTSGHRGDLHEGARDQASGGDDPVAEVCTYPLEARDVVGEDRVRRRAPVPVPDSSPKCPPERRTKRRVSTFDAHGTDGLKLVSRVLPRCRSGHSSPSAHGCGILNVQA